MANHKSALKRAKQNEIKRLRNKAIRTEVRSHVKHIRTAEPETAAADLKTAQATIDKAVKKGVLHKRAAARKVSRLQKMINSKQAG